VRRILGALNLTKKYFYAAPAIPHGLAMHDGAPISCNPGIHTNWPVNDSPTKRLDLPRIDFV